MVERVLFQLSRRGAFLTNFYTFYTNFVLLIFSRLPRNAIHLDLTLWPFASKVIQYQSLLLHAKGQEEGTVSCI
jgi:hypothetical protein